MARKSISTLRHNLNLATTTRGGAIDGSTTIITSPSSEEGLFRKQQQQERKRHVSFAAAGNIASSSPDDSYSSSSAVAAEFQSFTSSSAIITDLVCRRNNRTMIISSAPPPPIDRNCTTTISSTMIAGANNECVQESKSINHHRTSWSIDGEHHNARGTTTTVLPASAQIPKRRNTAARKRRKRIASYGGGGSEDPESGIRKRPSFVATLAPVFRQWSKLATAISSAASPSNTDAPSGDETEEQESTSEDVFLKRFSTRYLALSSRCSIATEGEISGRRKLSHHQVTYKRDEEDDGEDEEEDSGGRKLGLVQKWIRSRTVSPDGSFVFYWLSLVTICVLYNWWTLIVRQCFKELSTLDSHNVWFILDNVIDFLFVLEFVVQLRTGYLEQGLLVVDARKLARRYFLSKRFVLDAASLTPLDYFSPTYHPLLRFPRLLKTYRAIKFYYMLESRTVYPNATRVANWCHILLLACHWFACFHFMVAGLGEFGSRWTEWTADNVGNTSLTRKYLLSLYWSTLTLTTIGTTAVPGSEYEYLFTIISYLIGVFVFAAIVGQVGNAITNRNARRLEFERLSDGAKQYMRYHKVPKDMQRRVQQWFDYSWSRGRMTGNSDTHALSVLPDKLKTELALRVNLDTLRKVTMFQECQPQFLHDLVLKMRAVIFTPGDIVCRKGEVAREMYIIADGVLEVLNEDGDVLRVMRAGDFFGEIGILNLDSGLNKRSADVRSVGYSELFCLSREDVLAATKDYPDAETILREHGQRRLQSTVPRGSKILTDSRESILDGSSSAGHPRRASSLIGGGSQIIDATSSPSSLPRCSLTTTTQSLFHKVSHRRVEQRRSQSGVGNGGGGGGASVLAANAASHFLPDAYRNRSFSLASSAIHQTAMAAVQPPRQATVPSHVTNLLGCPVVNMMGNKESASRSNLLDDTDSPPPPSHDHHHVRPNSIDLSASAHPIRSPRPSELGYSCDEELGELKNVMHQFVCPHLYSNVIQETNKIQLALNAKFRTLIDLLRRHEVEVSALRLENQSLKDLIDQTQQRARSRSKTSYDIRILE